MSDLVEFLRERLADDERVARAAGGQSWGHDGRGGHHEANPTAYCTVTGPLNSFSHEPPAHVCGSARVPDATHIARHDPARVLAEVAAKRAVIEQYEHKQQSMALYPNQGNANGLMAFDEVLRLLAAVYADHADYRSDWAPHE